MKNSILLYGLILGNFLAIHGMVEQRWKEQEALACKIIQEVDEGMRPKEDLNNACNGLSVLSVLASNDLSLLIRALELGADPNYREELKDGYSYADRPLNYAVSLQAIEILLQHGANLQLCERSPIGYIFNYYVCHKRRNKPASMSNDEWLSQGVAVIKKLFDEGADPNQITYTGVPALFHIATGSQSFFGSKGDDVALEDKKPFIVCLMQCGANPNETWRKWYRPDETIYEYLSCDEYKDLVSFMKECEKSKVKYAGKKK